MTSYVITLARFFNARLDGIGVALSALCGVHCVAMPALLASGLAFAQSEHGHGHDYTHDLLFGAALPVTLLAIWRVLRHRHEPWILGVGGVGLIALWLGLSQDSHDLTATLTTLAGASLLAMFHLYHWRLHRLAHAAGHDHGHGGGQQHLEGTLSGSTSRSTSGSISADPAKNVPPPARSGHAIEEAQGAHAPRAD